MHITSWIAAVSMPSSFTPITSLGCIKPCLYCYSYVFLSPLLFAFFYNHLSKSNLRKHFHDDQVACHTDENIWKSGNSASVTAIIIGTQTIIHLGFIIYCSLKKKNQIICFILSLLIMAIFPNLNFIRNFSMYHLN